MIVGGAQENTLLTACGHLINGHSCVLLTGPSPGPEGELLRKKTVPGGLEVVECPDLIREINPLRDISAYRFLKRFFMQRNFDVVHTHSSKAGVIARAAARSANVPVIFHTVHGLAFHRYESRFKNMIYILSERWAAKRCDKILAVAQAMVDQCVSAKIANRDKFRVVYSGMELEPYLDASKKRSAIRNRLGIPHDAPVIGTVARLFPLKGYEDFIPAAAKIAKEIPEVRFLVVGDGEMMDDVKKEAEGRGLKFHFAGLVPPDQVAEQISAMDLLIHLSLREGLPRAVVQALAGGIPAIAYDLDGAPEVIVNGRSGYIVPPRDLDAVAKSATDLIRDSEKRKLMGQEGRKIALKNFDWKQMVDIIENLYMDKILSNQSAK